MVGADSGQSEALMRTEVAKVEAEVRMGGEKRVKMVIWREKGFFLLCDLRNRLQRGLASLCYRPWKGPSADYQCLTTLSAMIIYIFTQGVGLEVASEDSFNLLWVAGLTQGNIHHCREAP